MSGDGRTTWYTTGDLARLTGNTLRTVRYYEELGLIAPAARRHGEHRMFTAQDMERLRTISDLRAALPGMTYCFFGGTDAAPEPVSTLDFDANGSNPTPDTISLDVPSLTNADGTFLLEAAPGRYSLQVRALSYARKRIEGLVLAAGRLTPFSTGLSPEALAVEESPVTREVAGHATKALEHHIERRLRAIALFER